MLPEITKKDLGYWILILVLAIITILTWRLGDNPDVIGYLGFGGTIASILLAVVALIYSFFQTAASGNTTAILEDSAKKIESVTDSLKRVDKIVEIADKLESSLTILESLENNVTAATGIFEEGARKFEFFYSDKINGSEFTQNIKASDDESSNTNDQSLFVIEKLKIKRFVKMELLVLYSLILVNDTDNFFNLNKFSKYVTSNVFKLAPNEVDEIAYMISGFFHAISLQYTRSDLFKLVGDSNIGLQVTKFDSDLMRIILERSHLDENDPSDFPKIEDIADIAK